MGGRDEKNNKGGKERREIKWRFRAIDFERHRSKNVKNERRSRSAKKYKEREV